VRQHRFREMLARNKADHRTMLHLVGKAIIVLRLLVSGDVADDFRGWQQRLLEIDRLENNFSPKLLGK